MKKKKSFPRVFVRNSVLKFIEKAQQSSYKKHRSKTIRQQKNKPSRRRSLVQRNPDRTMRQEAESWHHSQHCPHHMSPKKKEFYLWCVLCHATLCTIPWKTEEANSKTQPHKVHLLPCLVPRHTGGTALLFNKQISKKICINMYTIMFLENSFPTQNLLSNTKKGKK